MLTVGIQDNVIVSEKTGKNDKGTLEIVFERKQQGNLADIFNSPDEAGSLGDESAKIILFPFSVEGYGGTTNSKEELTKQIKAVKDKLNSILLEYTTSENISWDVFAGTGIKTNEDFSKLTQQAVLDKIYNNLVTQFETTFKKVRTEDLKRVKFTRQSKAKKFPSLPKFGAFIEDMSVPADQSALTFTKWEVENGYNSAADVAADEVDDTVSADEASLFNR